DNIIPQLEEHSSFQTMIWQQDGAPPHYGQIVRDYLDDTFLHWIGRRGTIEWPPRSIKVFVPIVHSFGKNYITIYLYLAI
ncbi:unnamed protein product, partial [Rotaria magnacalcarata]